MEVYHRLPEDLQAYIQRLIFNERHVLARLLLREKMLCASSIGDIVIFWNAIRSLGVVDEFMDRAARNDHDRWYQYCEWERGENHNDLFTTFANLETTLQHLCRFVHRPHIDG